MHAKTVTASDVKVGDRVVNGTRGDGSDVVTKVYFSGKFVHITTRSETKIYSRKAILAIITD